MTRPHLVAPWLPIKRLFPRVGPRVPWALQPLPHCVVTASVPAPWGHAGCAMGPPSLSLGLVMAASLALLRPQESVAVRQSWACGLGSPAPFPGQTSALL